MQMLRLEYVISLGGRLFPNHTACPESIQVDLQYQPTCQRRDYGSRCWPRKRIAHLHSPYILTKRSGVVMCVGGPALVYWVSPTEEELFKACHKYQERIHGSPIDNGGIALQPRAAETVSGEQGAEAAGL